ncbi:hypothetical protein F2P56_022126, partial [Juglans regia]
DVEFGRKGYKLVGVYTASFSRFQKPSQRKCFVRDLYGVRVPCASHMGFRGWWDCVEKREEPKRSSFHSRTSGSSHPWEPIHPQPWPGTSLLSGNGLEQR